MSFTGVLIIVNADSLVGTTPLSLSPWLLAVWFLHCVCLFLTKIISLNYYNVVWHWIGLSLSNYCELFVAVINPYSVFKFLIFKYSSLFTFYIFYKSFIVFLYRLLSYWIICKDDDNYMLNFKPTINCNLQW